jgi:dedicator of cytokinesis protein 3
MTLDGEEMVKFLHHVLDELFGMFSYEDGESTPWSGQAFQVLINMFTIINDTKFRHFRPVLETYISGHFSAAYVYK